jgi:hypothetical protein
MSFQHKLKFYKDEEGEYTDISPCDRNSIEKIIEDYWTGEQLPNGLELVVISNDDGQLIILEHSGKEVFEVYYIPVAEKFLFHKKSRIDLIHDTLFAFMTNDQVWLQSNLRKTKNENRLIRKNIKSKNFIYELTPKRLWSQLNMTLLFGIPLGLVFTTAAITVLFKLPRGTIFDLAMPLLLLLGLYLWIPGIIIHSRYKADGKNIKLKLSSGDDIIRLDLKGVKKDLPKSEILKLTIVTNPWYKLPWSDYGYTEIEFKNGDILNLTNLIIDQFEMVHKFPKVKLLSRTSIYPRLERQTAVK